MNKKSNKRQISFEGVPLQVNSRKVQPKHSLSQIHKDRSKVIPRKYKYNYNNIDEAEEE